MSDAHPATEEKSILNLCESTLRTALAALRRVQPQTRGALVVQDVNYAITYCHGTLDRIEKAKKS